MIMALEENKKLIGKKLIKINDIPVEKVLSILSK